MRSCFFQSKFTRCCEVSSLIFTTIWGICINTYCIPATYVLMISSFLCHCLSLGCIILSCLYHFHLVDYWNILVQFSHISILTGVMTNCLYDFTSLSYVHLVQSNFSFPFPVFFFRFVLVLFQFITWVLFCTEVHTCHLGLQNHINEGIPCPELIFSYIIFMLLLYLIC